MKDFTEQLVELASEIGLNKFAEEVGDGNLKIKSNGIAVSNKSTS